MTPATAFAFTQGFDLCRGNWSYRCNMCPYSISVFPARHGWMGGQKLAQTCLPAWLLFRKEVSRDQMEEGGRTSPQMLSEKAQMRANPLLWMDAYLMDCRFGWISNRSILTTLGTGSCAWREHSWTFLWGNSNPRRERVRPCPISQRPQIP